MVVMVGNTAFAIQAFFLQRYHPAQPGLLTAVKVTASVRQKAVGDIFKPAPAIVDDVLVQQFNNAPEEEDFICTLRNN